MALRAVAFQRRPQSGDQAPERLSRERVAGQADQPLRRVVGVLDRAFPVYDEDTLLQGLEDLLEQGALPRQALDEVRHVDGIERVEPAEKPLQ